MGGTQIDLSFISLVLFSKLHLVLMVSGSVVWIVCLRILVVFVVLYLVLNFGAHCKVKYCHVVCSLDSSLLLLLIYL